VEPSGLIGGRAGLGRDGHEACGLENLAGILRRSSSDRRRFLAGKPPASHHR